MIRVIELFSGIGSQTQALKNIGVEHEVVAVCEIDKYAHRSYEAIHGKTLNLGDITKVEKLPDCDLLTYSFPCTDLSLAGQQKGMERGSGTRSGLLWEVERLLKSSTPPKYLLMENVKPLVGEKFIGQFNEWQAFLWQMGYKNYWKVLNAKDYGIPQNRERVFMISIFGEHDGYSFPEPMKLEKRLKDVLEDEVDEKYYLSEKMIAGFTAHKERHDGKGTGFSFAPKDDCDIASCIRANAALCPTDNTIKIAGNLNLDGRHESACRVYGDNGLAPTMVTGAGGDHIPKVLCYDIPQMVTVRKFSVDIALLKSKLSNRQGISIQDIAIQCGVSKTTAEHWFRKDSCFSIPDANSWVKIKSMLGIPDSELDLHISEFIEKPNEYEKSNRVYGDNGISPTLTTVGTDESIMLSEENHRIRKLTPLECWRLMSFSDEDFYKAQAVNSKAQLYKQAGNSIVVKVLEGIFRSLLCDNKGNFEPMQMNLF